MNPPICARYATPPPATPKPPIKNGIKFWNTNQNGRKYIALMCIILQKKPSIMNVSTLAHGKIIRYAPKTPEIAPDAPTAGTPLPGSPKI